MLGIGIGESVRPDLDVTLDCGGANVRDTGHANNFYTAIHAWGHPRYEYWVRGSVQIANSEVDGATEAGVRVDEDGLIWIGGSMISVNKGSPVGFYFAPSSSGHHSIVGPIIHDIQASAYVSVANGAKLNDSTIQIPGQARSPAGQ